MVYFRLIHFNLLSCSKAWSWICCTTMMIDVSIPIVIRMLPRAIVVVAFFLQLMHIKWPKGSTSELQPYESSFCQQMIPRCFSSQRWNVHWTIRLTVWKGISQQLTSNDLLTLTPTRIQVDASFFPVKLLPFLISNFTFGTLFSGINVSAWTVIYLACVVTVHVVKWMVKMKCWNACGLFWT